MANCNHSFNISSDEPVENPCKPCIEAGIPKEATTFCVDCGELFCQKCLLDHNKFSVMRSHQTVDLSEHGVPKQASQRVSLPTERCDVHHGKLVDMFCQDHDEVCCAACIAVQHRSCEKVKYIPEIASQYKESLKVEEVKVRAEKVLGSLSGEEEKRNSHITIFDNQKDESLQKIDDFQEKLIKKSKELAKSTKMQVREKHQSLVEALKADLAKIKREEALVQGHKQKLERNCEVDSQLFVDVKKCMQVVKNTEEVLKGISNAFSARTLKMHVNTELYETLNSSSSFGEVYAGPAKYKLELHKTYRVRSPDETYTCNITAVCVLQNEDLLLSDYQQSNIKRLDRNYSRIDSLQLDSSPISISKISPGKVAVALREKKKILFVNLDGRMKIKNSFDLDRKCNGTCFSDESLYICLGGKKFSDGNGKIGVYDIGGKLLREYEKDNSGNFIFSSPVQIAVSQDGDRFFVSDRENGLLCLDKTGSVIWTFSDTSLQDCWGLCVLPDCLLVSGLVSKNILQVSFDGDLFATALAGLKKQTWNITHLVQPRRIVLGQDSDDITVYNLR